MGAPTGKSEFIRAAIKKKPSSTYQEVNQAWLAAGNKIDLGTMFYQVRSADAAKKAKQAGVASNGVHKPASKPASKPAGGQASRACPMDLESVESTLYGLYVRAHQEGVQDVERALRKACGAFSAHAKAKE